MDLNMPVFHSMTSVSHSVSIGNGFFPNVLPRWSLCTSDRVNKTWKHFFTSLFLSVAYEAGWQTEGYARARITLALPPGFAICLPIKVAHSYCQQLICHKQLMCINMRNSAKITELLEWSECADNGELDEVSELGTIHRKFTIFHTCSFCSWQVQISAWTGIQITYTQT